MGRLIPENANTSKQLASLSPKAMALYFLLQNKLSMYGKMNGDTYAVKGVVCRHVEWLGLKEIGPCLEELSHKTSVKYWADKNGDLWIHDIGFEEHQRGSLRKDKRGKDYLPSWPGEALCRTTPGPLPENSSYVSVSVGVNVIEPPKAPHGGQDEILDLKNSVSGEQTVEAKTVTGRAKTPRRGELTKQQQALFEQFWLAYPAKMSKGQAEKTWAKLKPNEQLFAKILQGVERAKTSEMWLKDGGKWIPYPSTWLNAKGWLDVIGAKSGMSGIDAWLQEKEAKRG